MKILQGNEIEKRGSPRRQRRRIKISLAFPSEMRSENFAHIPKGDKKAAEHG
jgi:hypothetical protein